MKSDSLLKPIAISLGIALLIYAVFYTSIEHRRTRNGPWQVTFTNAGAAPAIIINQPGLVITNVQISFPNETNPPNVVPGTLSFGQPKQVPFDLPFGKCVFMDTTFLPGTIVFDFFGHEIQLIPRVLTIDKTEIPWQSGAMITVSGTNAFQSRVSGSH